MRWAEEDESEDADCEEGASQAIGTARSDATGEFRGEFSSVESEAQAGPSDATARGACIGVALAAGEVPVSFFDGCAAEGRHGARSNSASIGFSAGLPVGPLVLESQTTATGELVFGGKDNCISSEPAYKTGTHADRLRGVETGAFSATNLRLRYQTPIYFPVIAAAGAGWV